MMGLLHSLVKPCSTKIFLFSLETLCSALVFLLKIFVMEYISISHFSFNINRKIRLAMHFTFYIFISITYISIKTAVL